MAWARLRPSSRCKRHFTLPPGSFAVSSRSWCSSRKPVARRQPSQRGVLHDGPVILDAWSRRVVGYALRYYDGETIGGLCLQMVGRRGAGQGPDARSRREEHGLESPQYMFFCPVTFLAFDSKITKVRFDK